MLGGGDILASVPTTCRGRSHKNESVVIREGGMTLSLQASGSGRPDRGAVSGSGANGSSRLDAMALESWRKGRGGRYLGEARSEAAGDKG